MTESGVPIEQVLKRVGAGVKLASKGRQEPWSEGLIDGDFFFRPGLSTGASESPAVSAAAFDPAAIELSYWESVKDSRNPDELKAYLEQYPDGRFAELAKTRLKAQVAAVAPTDPRNPEYRSVGKVELAYPQHGYFVFRQNGAYPVPDKIYVKSGNSIFPMRVENRRGEMISGMPLPGSPLPGPGTEILIEAR